MVSSQETEAVTHKEDMIPHEHLFKVTGLSSSNLQKLDHQDSEAQPADFETAIAATGFGKFNLYLVLCCVPGFASAITVTSSVSFIFTKAQCDLDMTLQDMGIVNAITYGGMCSSAVIWGFLSDTLGRRQIMAWGFFCSGLVEVVAALSQNFAMLLVTRFLSGFLFNGPMAIQLTYLAELHRSGLRARMIMLTSLLYTIPSSLLPLLAWFFLTKDMDWFLFGGKIILHSWNLFLLACALVPLVTGIFFFFLPESPKFLMSRGRNEEALQVFQKLYSINHNKPREQFPIKSLVREKIEQASGLKAMRGGWSQLKPLFQPPYILWLVMMCTLQIGVSYGSNTLRLWYPQLAAMIGSTGNGTLCSAISDANVAKLALELAAANETIDDVVTVCEPIETDIMTYLQSALVGSGSFLTLIIGGIIVNKCGKRVVLGISAVSAAVIISLLPVLGNGSTEVVLLVTAGLGLASLTTVSLQSVNVDLFPTSLRAMSMGVFLMCGRLGTMLGTSTFPNLVQLGCHHPFFTIGCVLAVCGLACCLLPSTTRK